MNFNNGSSNPSQTPVDPVHQAAENIFQSLSPFITTKRPFPITKNYGFEYVKGKIDNSHMNGSTLAIPDYQPRQVSSCEASSLQIFSLKKLMGRPATFETLLQRRSYKKGDIVSKFMFESEKMVWELDIDGVKIKMTTSWDHIEFITVRLQQNTPAHLQLKCTRPPVFTADAKINPRRYHPPFEFNLKPFSDPNSNYRHVVEFPPGVIDKHVQELIRQKSNFSASFEDNNIVVMRNDWQHKLSRPFSFSPNRVNKKKKSKSKLMPSNFTTNQHLSLSQGQGQFGTIQSRVNSNGDQQLKIYHNSNVRYFCGDNFPHL